MKKKIIAVALICELLIFRCDAGDLDAFLLHSEPIPEASNTLLYRKSEKKVLYLKQLNALGKLSPSNKIENSGLYVKCLMGYLNYAENPAAVGSVPVFNRSKEDIYNTFPVYRILSQTAGLDSALAEYSLDSNNPKNLRLAALSIVKSRNQEKCLSLVKMISEEQWTKSPLVSTYLRNLVSSDGESFWGIPNLVQ